MHNFYNEIPKLLAEKGFIDSPQEKCLEIGEENSSKELGGGKNETSFVELKTGEKGVFKPQKGEVHLREIIKEGSYYKRERAAYIVDRFLKFNLVPTTVIRKIDRKIGSLQEFIPDALLGYEYETYKNKEEREEIEKELVKMLIFDLIIWSSDRYGKNFLVKKSRVYAIDNGLSFGNDFLRVYPKGYNKPVPEEIIDKFKKFFENKDKNEKDLKAALKDLLDEKEIDACIKRISTIGNLIINNKVISKKDNLTFN